MLKNYFATATRNLRKNPAHSLLNITGLALGIACAALILLWVEDELNWDHQVPDRNRIYMARMNMPYQGTIASNTAGPTNLGPAAGTGIPGIQHFFRYSDGERKLFTIGTKTFYDNGTYADSGYFDITKIPFLKGSPHGCLRRLHSIVLTDSTATKFFGDQDPMGKTVRMDTINYTVTGVVREFPNNTSLGFNWLASFDDWLAIHPMMNDWGNWGRPMVFELEPGVDPKLVENKLTAMIRSKNEEYAHVDMVLWSIKDWHLYDNFTNGKPDGGQIKFVKLFSLIASIILLIACINFMNLATARAGKRAREVGVRKTLGALRQSLVNRFIAESMLLSFVAVALAVLLVFLALPAFNTLVGKELTFDPLQPVHLTGLIGIGLVCGLLSGSYPAFYLSAFSPVTVLKGMKVNPKGSAGFVRKALVITQFVASVILIICTIIIYQQIQHIKDRDLGFDKENLAYLDIQGKMGVHYQAIRDHLMETGVLDHVALSFSPPLTMYGGADNSYIMWEGDDVSTKTFINQEGISPGYVATMGLKIKEGRDFYPETGVDSNSVLINESLATLMGKAGKPGSRITFNDNSHPVTVVGIVKNFVVGDMYGATPNPVIFYGNPSFNKYAHSLDLRFKAGVNISAAINKITAVLKADNPGYPVEVKFADVDFQHRFDSETRIGELAALFAALAIFISCLGLFGLAAYTAEQRTKELGIRKVLGASIPHLAGLLSREFLQLVSLSCLIAFPLSWWAMSNWLSSYAYRTPIYWWVFAAAGIGALVIALLTVIAQALKAALLNPVNTLRSE